jgi:hypothetical protein
VGGADGAELAHQAPLTAGQERLGTLAAQQRAAADVAYDVLIVRLDVSV